ncbi:hypothetical protein HYE68_008426 [Fusarium pseudograminearum]|nr:hypothetical protein HYE68_008426 [Fusarium pseudograminearum]
MSSPTSSYVFDDQNMTWITCDLCAGSFQRGADVMEPNSAEYLIVILLREHRHLEYKEALLHRHLLLQRTTNLITLTGTQVVSASTAVAADELDLWQG